MTQHGEETWTLDPEEEAAVREILDRDDSDIEWELSRMFDSWLSDIGTYKDMVIEEDDGSLVWEGEL